MAYDQRCEDLARAFLPDDAPVLLVDRLAQYIADRIEEFLGEEENQCGRCESREYERERLSDHDDRAALRDAGRGHLVKS